MKNKYIRAVLDKNNEFRVEADFVVLDIMAFGVDVKLDTGCTCTNIPMRTIGGLSDTELIEQKKKDLINKTVVKRISRGIETGKKEIKIPNKLVDAIKEEHFVFRHTLQDVFICEIPFGDIEANLSYDFNGNILIGMDIMKDWDIHIGKNKQGETVFLGCPYNQLNQKYYLALENEFELSENLNSAIINKTIRH